MENAQAVIKEAEAAKKRLRYMVDYWRGTGFGSRSLNAIDLIPIDRIIAKAQKYLDEHQSQGAVISHAEFEGLRREIKVVTATLNDKIEKIAKDFDETQKTQAEKNAERTEVKKSPSLAPKPTLPPLGESVGTAAQRLVFNVVQNTFAARVGEKFFHSFCEPAIMSASDLCTAAATNPEFGLPPYSFVLQTGTGFPPQGIILNKNGILDGAPTIDGSRTFGVCAVDQGGVSVCRTVIVEVLPKKEEVPPYDYEKYNNCVNTCDRDYRSADYNVQRSECWTNCRCTYIRGVTFPGECN